MDILSIHWLLPYCVLSVLACALVCVLTLNMRAHFNKIWVFGCFTASLALLLSNLVVFWIIVCWSRMGSLSPFFRCSAIISGWLLTLCQAYSRQSPHKTIWTGSPSSKDAVLLNGLVCKKLTSSGSVDTTHTGKQCSDKAKAEVSSKTLVVDCLIPTGITLVSTILI